MGGVEIGGDITSSNSGIVVDGSITAKSNNGYGVYVGGDITSAGTGMIVNGSVSGGEYGI